jgi:hypothetical protein
MDEGLTGALRETADGLGHLVAEHVRRSKLELVLGGRILARITAIAVVAGTLLLAGDLLLSAAAATALASSVGVTTGLLLVGGAQLALGAAGLCIAKARLERSRIFEGAAGEVGRSVLAITTSGPAVAA